MKIFKELQMGQRSSAGIAQLLTPGWREYWSFQI